MFDGKGDEARGTADAIVSPGIFTPIGQTYPCPASAIVVAWQMGWLSSSPNGIAMYQGDVMQTGEQGGRRLLLWKPAGAPITGRVSW